MLYVYHLSPSLLASHSFWPPAKELSWMLREVTVLGTDRLALLRWLFTCRRSWGTLASYVSVSIKLMNPVSDFVWGVCYPERLGIG